MTIRTLTLAAVLLTTVAAVAETTYQVKRGDTLKRIAQKLGVSVDSLRSANHLSGSHLSRGQVLTIPSTSTTDCDDAASVPKPIGTVQLANVTTTPHAGPFDGSKSMDPVDPGSTFQALAQKPGWFEVQIGDTTGWLSSDLLTYTPFPAPIPAPAPKVAKADPAPVTTDDVIKEIAGSNNELLKKALTYRGVRYRWGGTSRSSGVDCSGFTSSVFASQGIKLPRTSIEQSQIGKAVSKADLKAGDLVFFRTGRSYRVNHVGIYVGEGKFIHAATGAGHVMVSSLGEKYYLRCYAMARRVADFETGSRAAEESTKDVTDN